MWAELESQRASNIALAQESVRVSEDYECVAKLAEAWKQAALAWEQYEGTVSFAIDGDELDEAEHDRGRAMVLTSAARELGAEHDKKIAEREGGE